MQSPKRKVWDMKLEAGGQSWINFPNFTRTLEQGSNNRQIYIKPNL